MAGIEDVLERLVVDDDFRAALARDPHAALLEYDLTPAEVALLASRLDDGDETQRAVEQRTSKSALLAALGVLAGEATDGVGADETLPVGGNRTEGPTPRGPLDEYTKVPAPPAPPVPVPLPQPNTAEAEVAVEALERSPEDLVAADDVFEIVDAEEGGGRGS